MITHSRLLERLLYDPATGVFIWKEGTYRKSRAGTIAGSIAKSGHRVIFLEGRYYKAHRLAWFYVHGAWPSKFIDHINRDPDDNRISNLRDVSIGENNQNRVNPGKGKVLKAPLGVCWKPKINKWQARISLNGECKYLGVYESMDDAHQAYLAAKENLHATYTHR